MSTPPPLAGGAHGPAALQPLLATTLRALREGAEARRGPLPAGGPEAVADRVRAAALPLLPEQGEGPEAALRSLVHALAEGAADPADPLCAAHLHCPPLAVAAVADLAASALNPSMDSWDQAPAASTLESLVTHTLTAEIYATGDTLSAPGDAPGGGPGDAFSGGSGDALSGGPGGALLGEPGDALHGGPGDAPGGRSGDALVTTGGTEANQLALLLAREDPAAQGPLRLFVGANAHHSLARAAWLLGLPAPTVIPTPTGTLDPTALDQALTATAGPPGTLMVAATAGTTDAGLIDPLDDIADLCATHSARLHIDAAYGAGLLFSDVRKHLLHGIHRAHTVTLDLHKLGWQPAAAGLLAVRHPTDLTALTHSADYLNADDDTHAGLPDLLGRSLRTTRRPDILKIAVTLKALGRQGLGALVDQVCDQAQEFAALIDKHPRFELHDTPTISTVLFRPTDADDHHIAHVRRQLLTEGTAVLGRADLAGRRWLKATLLNPHTRPEHLSRLLALVEHHHPARTAPHPTEGTTPR